jgi:hypothetical protein
MNKAANPTRRSRRLNGPSMGYLPERRPISA